MEAEIVLPLKPVSARLLVARACPLRLLVKQIAPQVLGQIQVLHRVRLAELDTRLTMRETVQVLARRWRVFVMQATVELVMPPLVRSVEPVNTKGARAM